VGFAHRAHRRLSAKAAALGLLACVGVANTLVDFGQLTLMGRLAPDEVLARVSGVLESLIALTVGLGALVASVVIEVSSLQATLVSIGVLCPLAAAAGWRRLHQMDQSIGVRDRDIMLLHNVAVLTPLPLPAIEQLARGPQPVSVPTGQVVFNQGEVGDRTT
jgi:hypothetical protein